LEAATGEEERMLQAEQHFAERLQAAKMTGTLVAF